MEPGNLPSAAGSATHDLSSEGIHVATRVLSGLNIHANQVDAPLPLVFQASQSNLPQILESLREMKDVQGNEVQHMQSLGSTVALNCALREAGFQIDETGLLTLLYIQEFDDYKICNSNRESFEFKLL